jgi:ABC-type transport system involved in multi-copper enzyme maturation permease subunit
LAMYLIGHGGPIFRFIYNTTETPIVATLLKSAYHVMPNLDKFNVRNDIVYGTLPTLSMVSFALVYACVYGAFLLFLTVLVFRKKDF